MPLEKTLAIFGYPLGHTLSPVMHNAAAQALGLPYRFTAYEVHPDQYEEAVRGAGAMGFAGFCVTIPHKVATFELVDEVSEDARLMGAVNMVTFESDGKLKGHNTDGAGWLCSLEEETGVSPEGKKVPASGCWRGRAGHRHQACANRRGAYRDSKPHGGKSRIIGAGSEVAFSGSRNRRRRPGCA